MQSSSIRLRVLLPIMVLMLMACNLSAGANQPTVTPVVITATTQIVASSDEDITLPARTDNSSQTADELIVQSSSSIIPNDRHSQSADLYYVRGNRPNDQCAVQASVNTNIRTASNINADIVGQLVGGEWIPIVRLVDGWYQVDLSGTPVHRMWISREPAVLDSICNCDHNGCARQQIISTPVLDLDLFYTGNPQPYPASGCYVYTAGEFNVNIRAGQGETTERLGQLIRGHWIPVDYFVNGWFGIDLPNTVVDGAYVASGPVQLASMCYCDEVSCNMVSPSATCQITTHPYSPTTSIYTEPANWSRIVGALVDGETYNVTVISSSGWYQLYDGGWVPPNYIKWLTPDACGTVPRIAYDGPILDCQLVNTSDDIQTIFVEPNGDYYGRFPVGMSLGIISKQGAWYQVYVPAFESAGWVEGATLSRTGNCDAIE